jgi:hypothetical protein
LVTGRFQRSHLSERIKSDSLRKLSIGTAQFRHANRHTGTSRGGNARLCIQVRKIIHGGGYSFHQVEAL